jgi:malate dehydrogenase
MNRIAIIGAGRVGESTAHLLARDELCREVVLVDIREGAAAGTALDIQSSAPLFSCDTRLRGTTNTAEIEGAELVIITAGIARKPGMSRSDVLDTNLKVIESIVGDILKHAPQAMILMVSNPVDVLTYHTWRLTGWHRQRVFGQAGVLDSARMAAFIALETGFSVKDINTMVLGGHGDAMVPMVRYTTISGIPVEVFLETESIDRIVERTRMGGAEILALRKNSSAYDAPAAAILEMVSAIVHDRKRILPCVAILDGEYGEENLAIGVPAVLGKGGLEQIVELELNDEEQEMFSHSVSQTRDVLDQVA